MATVHFRNAKIFFGGYDLSGDHASVEVVMTVEVLDETCFGDTTRIHKGGLEDVQISGSGYWDATAGHVDAVMFGAVGIDDEIITVFPNGLTEGTGDGFACKGLLNSYNVSGDVGSLLAFDMAISGRGIG